MEELWEVPADKIKYKDNYQLFYPMGDSKKTNIQMKLRLGDITHMQRMNMVSNKVPEESHFDYFKKKAMSAKDSESVLKSLNLERIKNKGIEIAKIKKNGFKVNEREKDLHIDRGVERGLRSGNMKGQNNTYLKQQIKH